MKRSEKYKMNIHLDRQTANENFNKKPTVPLYILYWHKDNEGSTYGVNVYLTDIAPPITPEIDLGIPLDVLFALNEQYGEQLNADLQNCLDLIENKKN